MSALTVAFHALTVVMVGLVLAQRGGGAGLTSLFGGGGASAPAASAPSRKARATALVALAWVAVAVALIRVG